jgi:hypothetical protein
MEGHESKIQRVSVNMCLVVHHDVVREFNIRQDHPTGTDQEIGVTLTRSSGGGVREYEYGKY